jgi:uncharacterized protein YkwD
MRKTKLRAFLPLLLAVIVPWMAGCNLFTPSTNGTPGEIEQQIFKLVNDHRRSIGAAELVWNETIAEQARLHSRDMADGTVPFGHDGASDRWARIGETIPWRAAAEVIAISGSAADTVNAWIASAEHRPWIEGNYDLTGVGVIFGTSGSSFYATQIFIKPR